MDMKEKKRDSERTIKAILERATEEFAVLGFEGARMDSIAEAAGVNKATIYYHVGGKDALYEMVIVQLLGGLVDELIDAVQQEHDPVSQLRVYVRSVVSNITERSCVGKVLLREFLSEGKHLPPAIAKDMERLLGLLEGILTRGYQAGVFVKAIPFAVHFMVVGASMLYKVTAPAREHVPIMIELARKLGVPDTREISNELEERILRSILTTNSDGGLE
jgi:TetR/AcrR family transcriptional regulator